MSQLNLFQNEDSAVEIIIPKEVVSPLETNKGIKTKEFRQIQLRFSQYVRAIQEQYNCSWFEARKILFEHRDNEKPIKLKKEIRQNETN